MSQIGVGECFGFIPEQEHDIARLGLRLQELAAQAGAIHGVCILAALQGMARPAPAEIHFGAPDQEKEHGIDRSGSTFGSDALGLG